MLVGLPFSVSLTISLRKGVLTCVAEVDEAVAAQQQDGTGGRGANGHITQALAEEHKKDETLKNAV